MVKNLPAMQETHVQFLGQEDLLEKGMATHSRILAQRTPWTETVHGVVKSQTRLEKKKTLSVSLHVIPLLRRLTITVMR